MQENSKLETLVRDRKDPDFWLTIPDFGVSPESVSYQGFATPIVEPGAEVSRIHLLVRQNVRTARQLIQLNFTSLKTVKDLWVEAMLIDSDVELSFNQKNANLYMWVMISQETVLRMLARASHPGSRQRFKFDECLDEMAKTASLLRSWALTLGGRNDDTVNEFRRDMSERNRRAADAKHSQPGGSREKWEAIRKIWALGKFDTRQKCADQESAALGMSYSTALKALRNTPNPVRASAL